MDCQFNFDQQAAHKQETDKSPTEIPDVNRWADMIANGQMGFPKDLPAQAEAELARAVGRLRRQRLLNFIAHAIAMDIHRDRETQRRK